MPHASGGLLGTPAKELHLCGLNIPVLSLRPNCWFDQFALCFIKYTFFTQYEMRTYYHYLEFSRLTESTLKSFLEYFERNLPEGVAMKVTKHERKPLPDAILNTIKNSAST